MLPQVMRSAPMMTRGVAGSRRKMKLRMMVMTTLRLSTNEIKKPPRFSELWKCGAANYKPNYNWRKISAIRAAAYSDTLVKKAQPVPLQANE